MAEIVKDFTNDNSGFEQVLFQRGRKIIDGEMNEVGRLIRVSQKRQNLFPSSDQGEEAGEYGFPFVQGLEIVPNGASTTEIIVQPIAGRRALIAYRGYVFELTAPIVLTGVASGFGAESVQQVYVTFTETEISAAADPSILVSQLGETAVRIKADVQISLSAINVDDAGAASTASEPWEGGTKACVIAEIRKGAGAATVLGGAELQYKYIRTLDMEALNQGVVISPVVETGQNTGFFQWDDPDLSVSRIRVTVPLSTSSTGFGSGTVTALASMPNAGDCLVLEVPIDLTADTVEYTYSFTPTAKQGKISVINQADMILNHAFTENARRLIILAYRTGISGQDVILANGNVICYSAPNPAIFRGARVYPGTPNHDRGIVYHDRDEVTAPNSDSDQTPYVRGFVRPTAGSYKLLYENTITPGSGAVNINARMYLYDTLAAPLQPGAGASPIAGEASTGIAYTVNARWDGTQWVADDTFAASAYIWRMHEVPFGSEKGSHLLGGMLATPLPLNWTDADWGSEAVSGSEGMDISLSDGYIIGNDETTAYLDNFRYVKLTGTSDPVAPAAPASSNRLHALNIVKAHATVISGGAGAGTLGTGGYGITTVVNQTPIPAVGRGLDVTLANAMAATTAYQVVATLQEQGASYNISVENISATTFRIWLRDTATNTLEDISGLPATRISVIVMGLEA